MPTVAIRFTISLFILLILTALTAEAQRHQPPALPHLSDAGFGPADFDWTVATLEGEIVRLSEFEGQVLYVHVWATYCGICVGELPSIQRLWESVRDRNDVAFIMVAKDAEAAEVEEFMLRRGFDFPVYLRAGRSDVFRVSPIPSTYIVDRSGMLRAHVTGAADWRHASVRAFLFALVGG